MARRIFLPLHLAAQSASALDLTFLRNEYNEIQIDISYVAEYENDIADEQIAELEPLRELIPEDAFQQKIKH